MKRLTPSYVPPVGDPLGDRIRDRAWTYDASLTVIARALSGDLDGAGSVLDFYQEVQRADGAIEASYDLSGANGDGPLRAGNQAWVGLAALQWRSLTCSGRHDRLIARLADWLLTARISDERSPGFGLVRGGPDVSWASTEHNLEARAFFSGLDAVLAGRVVDPIHGRRCAPGLDGLSGHASRMLAASVSEAVVRLDRAISVSLFDAQAAQFRQGLGDDAHAVDTQAFGILWLLAHGRRADAVAVERATDASMRVSGRVVDWPGAAGKTFAGYKPFADSWGPDVLWMEGTLMMRLAKTRLGRDVAALDRDIDRWAALSAPAPPLQVDRVDGEDYHVWPAAAPAAWLVLSRGRFALL